MSFDLHFTVKIRFILFLLRILYCVWFWRKITGGHIETVGEPLAVAISRKRNRGSSLGNPQSGCNRFHPSTLSAFFVRTKRSSRARILSTMKLFSNISIIRLFAQGFPTAKTWENWPIEIEESSVKKSTKLKTLIN